MAILAAVVGQRVAGSGGVAGAPELLSLTSSAGTTLDESLTAATLEVSASSELAAGRRSGPTYTLTATTGVAPASVDTSLVEQFDTTRWVSATVTFDNVSTAPTYRFADPTLQAYVLDGGAGEPSVHLTLTSGELTPPSPSTTTVPPTTIPRPAAQACVPNPQKTAVVRPSFPLASWEVPTSGTIRQSSPTLATVVSDDRHETVAVFGDEDGWLYVVDAATCQLLPGWPQRLAVPAGQLLEGLAAGNQHAVIESTPAVGFPNGPDGEPEIVVGAGSTWDNTGVGEVEAFDLSGEELWDFPVQGSAENANGVFSSPAFGAVVPDTGLDVVFGSWDDYLYVLDAAGREVARYDNGETIWSSPALYEVPGQDTDDIFVGLDKSEVHRAGGCVGGQFAELRYGIVPPGAAASGATGLGTTYVAPDSSALAAGLHGGAGTRHLEATAARLGLYLVRESGCQGAPGASRRGEAIWSSPAIGEVGGQLVAAVGTSFYDAPYTAFTDRLYVYPVSSTVPFHWEPVWTGATPGPVLGSPAIGELADPSRGSPVAGLVDTSFDCPPPPQTRTTCLGTGLSEVQAWVPPANGKAGLLSLLWARTLPGGDSLASPVLVPLRGELSDDVLVGSGGGLFPLDGGTGAFLYGTGTDPPQLAIHSACILFNSPAVADVLVPGPYSGWFAYELCSYGGGAQGGGLFAYRLPEAPASVPAWPMFRGDPSHSGVSWSTLGRGSPPGDPTS